MLHAAAMLFGLAIIWLIATGGFSRAEDIIVAVGAALVCVLVAWRSGSLGGFSHAPRGLYAAAVRSASVLSGAVKTIRAALAADITLQPALVRIKTRGRGAERVAFADLLSATPGSVVVETDPEGFLVHVMNEDAVDAAELGRLERVAGGQNEGGER